MIPTKKDLKDFWNQLKFFFGKTKVKSRFGRFSFIEKFDYWAVYWGFLIMIGSGMVMWLFQGKLNPWLFGEIDLSFVPLTVNNYIHAISREAHSDEALLATLAIIVWHFYNVHFNPDKFPGNKVWITGTMSEKEMAEEHPLELEEIEKSAAKTETDDKENSVSKSKIEHEKEVIPEQTDESINDKDSITKDDTAIKEIKDETTAENIPEENTPENKTNISKDENAGDIPGKTDFKEKK
jgi:cytochrome b subunit of formate dehydrogenase